MGLDSLAVLLDDPKAIFYPGQHVTGRVQLDLKETMKIREVRLRFHGYADVHWSESRGSGKNRRTVHYRNNETYIDMTVVLYGKEQTHEDSVVLQPGNYPYTFSFQLPPNCPSSYEAQIGRVRYFLQATIDRPWAFDKHAKTMFTVVNLLDLNRVTTHGNLNQGGEFTMSKTLCCLCCESDPITGVMKVQNRTGYVPGESILFSAEINNLSSRTMNASYVKVVMQVIYHARTKSRTVNNVVNQLEHGKIEPGGSDVWVNEKIGIPAVPPSFLQGCNIIEIKYQAMLVVDPAGPGFDLNVPVEVVVGSIPLANIAQQYGMTIPTMPAAPPSGAPDGLYSEVYMPPALPQATYAQSALGGANMAEGTEGEDNQGQGEFAPKYTYYDWEKRDPASNFTVVLNEHDQN